MNQKQTEAQTGGSGRMFDSIAERYDLLNRVISLGVDQGWRIRTVLALELRANARVLDLATGTADLAIMLARAEASARVVGLDPSQRMLAVGKKKAKLAGVEQRVELVVGDAQALPFEDDSFDAISMAFGIRNVENREQALGEMVRVTRPGGRIAILELSEPPKRGLMAPFVRFHVHNVVPWMGALLSGADQYRYLQRSIAAFPAAPAFAKSMERAGMKLRETRPLTFGVCHLYVGEKPT